MKVLENSAWFCMDLHKKYSFDKNNLEFDKKKIKKSKRTRKKISLLGALKGPCTLP